MVIIVQEPEIPVYHRVGHNIDDTFSIAAYKGTTAIEAQIFITCNSYNCR